MREQYAAIAVTLDAYNHFVEGMKREAASRLDILLGSLQLSTIASRKPTRRASSLVVRLDL